MKSDTPNTLSADEVELDAEDVARYLSAHPDFFSGREDLLKTLTIPHESGRAVSLLERQVSLLRERNEELNRRLDEFVNNANANDTLFEKTRIIILALLKAGSLEQLADTLEREIAKNFQATESRLLLITDKPRDFPGITSRHYAQARETLGELFEKKRAFCGELDEQQTAFLFPETTGEIVSVAIVPVHVGVPDFDATPLLAIGSTTSQHFNNRQDTLFLDFIGEVLAALIAHLQ